MAAHGVIPGHDMKILFHPRCNLNEKEEINLFCLFVFLPGGIFHSFCIFLVQTYTSEWYAASSIEVERCLSV